MAIARYFVTDVEKSIQFYREAFGFGEKERRGSEFAIIHRAGLELWLSGPGTTVAAPISDGRTPEPGGWNRVVVSVSNLNEIVIRLHELGAHFRNDPLVGPDGSQVLVEDPDGNPVEIFQPGSTKEVRS